MVSGNRIERRRFYNFIRNLEVDVLMILIFNFIFFINNSFNARQFTVRLGDVDLRRDDEPSSPETYYVTDVRGHHKFSRVGFYNDIAILVLDRPVRRNKYTIPLCLPPKSARSETFVGQSPTVVGWGTTYYGNNPFLFIILISFELKSTVYMRFVRIVMH